MREKHDSNYKTQDGSPACQPSICASTPLEQYWKTLVFTSCVMDTCSKTRRRILLSHLGAKAFSCRGGCFIAGRLVLLNNLLEMKLLCLQPGYLL